MAEDTELAPEQVTFPTPLERFYAFLGEPRSYRLTRSLLLRALGVVYLFAFLGLTKQAVPLLGKDGLTPIASLLDYLRDDGKGFWDIPTLFWFDASDAMLVACAWIGVALSIAVVLGYSNAPIFVVLWLLYGSFERTGQLWFSFGWEIQLLETGFLAIFFAPALDPRPTRSRPPSFVLVLLYRWLTFRIMLGAGLIKIRGDACWRDFTCLDHHFETQPIPNPASAWWHHQPHWVHAAGVAFNHLVELFGPWLVLFGRRTWRLAAAVAMVLFQGSLIISGNLAFLNWLTLVPVIACFDDDALRRVLPRRIRAWVDRRTARAPAAASRAATYVARALAVIVALKSIEPTLNLMSSHQAMNRDYDRLSLVNTYGAFGSVGDVRHELIIEGTRDEAPGEDTVWEPYELPCKPGDLDRTPCILGPYHYRLDWLIWFAAMYDEYTPRAYHVRWVADLVHKLLLADPDIRSLLARDPFGDEPPQWIRIRRFVYEFAAPDEGGWIRSDEQMWLDPISLLDFAPPEPPEPE
jgi:uncharacterized membrane protein YphA (DoxX/SURF4 family)